MGHAASYRGGGHLLARQGPSERPFPGAFAQNNSAASMLACSENFFKDFAARRTAKRTFRRTRKANSQTREVRSQSPAVQWRCWMISGRAQRARKILELFGSRQDLAKPTMQRELLARMSAKLCGMRCEAVLSSTGLSVQQGQHLERGASLIDTSHRSQKRV